MDQVREEQGNRQRRVPKAQPQAGARQGAPGDAGAAALGMGEGAADAPARAGDTGAAPKKRRRRRRPNAKGGVDAGARRHRTTLLEHLGRARPTGGRGLHRAGAPIWVDAPAALRQALQDLGTLPRTRLLRASSLYRSAPLQAQGPDFINAVALVRTGLTAPALLAALQGLEARAGRQRPYPNAPRTLDLDLLLYGQGHITSPLLTLPAPAHGAARLCAAAAGRDRPAMCDRDATAPCIGANH